MIYKTFALAFIFALAFAGNEGEVTNENENAVHTVPEKEGLLRGVIDGCKGLGCRIVKSFNAVNLMEDRASNEEHKVNKDKGETVRLVGELVNKIKKLLSESQKPKECATSPELAAVEFQTQLGKVMEKYLKPLMEKMDEAMEKLPEEVKVLFKEIMNDFQEKLAQKKMQELTQEELQQLLTHLKETYEVRVKDTMDAANKRFEMDAPHNEETEAQKANLAKLQNLMKQFEGKTQGEAMGMVTDPGFVTGVEDVLGKDVVREGIKKATAAIDDVTKVVNKAQCAAQWGLFEEDTYEL